MIGNFKKNPEYNSKILIILVKLQLKSLGKTSLVKTMCLTNRVYTKINFHFGHAPERVNHFRSLCAMRKLFFLNPSFACTIMADKC